MQRLKLARQRWQLGQVLMPAHFTAQEEALGNEIGLRAALLGLPHHGVARLAWDEELLATGVVAITALTAVLPDGAVIDVPGNAVVSNMSLDDAGAAEVDLYLHVLRETAGAEGMDLYHDDPREVTRVIRRLLLSPRSYQEGALGAIKLAELRKGADGLWSMPEAYAPPLVQIGASPFLRWVIEGVRRDLLELEEQLKERMIDHFFGGERLAAVRRATIEVVRLRAALVDIDSGIERHPYFFFDALRSFYLELCALEDAAPRPDPVPYDHEDLARCFGEILRRIREEIRTRRAAAPYRPFARAGGRLVAADLPAEALGAAEVYLLVQRPRAHEAISLEGVKLASPGRIDPVYALALCGVPFRKVCAPPFGRAFGPEIDFYLIHPAGPEWEAVVRERAICFYEVPAMDRARAALYWSVEGAGRAGGGAACRS